MNEKQKKELLDVKTYGNLGDNFHCKIEELELLINKFISQAIQNERERIINEVLNVTKSKYSENMIDDLHITYEMVIKKLEELKTNQK